MSDLDLLVIGDLNPDLIIGGDDVRPRFGQVETIVDSADLVIGGSAGIVSVGASRLGLSVGLCAVIGSDNRGRMIRSMVETEGVSTDWVRAVPGIATGISVILVERDDRAILTAPGTIEALTAEDIASLPDTPARHIHVASYYLMSDGFRSGLTQHLRRFADAGCSVSLDTNWDPSEQWSLADVLGSVDLFLPNEEELTAIAGGLGVDDALRTLGREVPIVAAKLGKRGGSVFHSDSITKVTADLSGEFVDAIGAGDSFDAGFIAGVLTGRSPEDALRLAVAVGTLSTRGVGGTATQPALDEAIRLAFGDK